jgi:predicted DCC family thiol-disulfide oxidoreductase YuxK
MDEATLDRPLLVFDGNCSFCRACVEYGKKLTGDQVSYAPYQEVGARFPQIAKEEFAAAVKLVLPDGEVRSGAHAVFSSLHPVPGKAWMLWLYERIPGAEAVAEAGYRLVANHRSLAYRVTKLFWGIPLEPSTFRLASWLFLRLLGAIYLIAFASFGLQAPGLVGSRGILPVAEYLPAVKQYLGAASYWSVPTLLWFNSSNAFIKADWVAGVCLALGLLFGVRWRPVRVGLFVLYLSLVTTSQVFLSYQWDALLLEAGFLAIFLGSSPLIVRLFRWLLFRLMFLSGAVKLLSGDPSWRNWTALPVHYESQPLPTPLAWYFYQLPAWFHRLSLGVMFAAEIVIPFLIFAPRRIRIFAAFALIVFQLLIFLTGNYAFFNLLAIALCLFLLDDRFLCGVLPQRAVAITPASDGRVRWPVLRNAVCRALFTVVLLVSGLQMIETFSGVRWGPAQAAINLIAPFEIVNTYGLFAVMTISRPEIVIEGSNDGVTWLPYEFKYKPGSLTRRPVWVQPHQPRLDWQMWFAALGDYRSDPWTLQLVGKLLEGSPDVLRLFGNNPFPGSPPHFIRAVVYEYRFTSAKEKKATGDWWYREEKGVYLPALSLKGQ